MFCGDGSENIETCILCESQKLSIFFQDPKLGDYFRCGNCAFVFRDPAARLNAEAERADYLRHNNDTQDPRYRNFLLPLCQEIQKCAPIQAAGLDFGAGAGPIAGTLLSERGFTMDFYDPFFWPDPAPWEKQFDFIVASEVVEHLYRPHAEFGRLRACLKPGTGFLAIMTLLLSRKQEFASWFYRREPTHVGFYSQESLEWLADKFQFSRLEIISERIQILYR